MTRQNWSCNRVEVGIQRGKGQRHAIGFALKRWRKKHKLSREKLAVLLDCSVVTIVRYERGLTEPMVGVVLSLDHVWPGLLKELRRVT